MDQKEKRTITRSEANDILDRLEKRTGCELPERHRAILMDELEDDFDIVDDDDGKDEA